MNNLNALFDKGCDIQSKNLTILKFLNSDFCFNSKGKSLVSLKKYGFRLSYGKDESPYLHKFLETLKSLDLKIPIMYILQFDTSTDYFKFFDTLSLPNYVKHLIINDLVKTKFTACFLTVKTEKSKFVGNIHVSNAEYIENTFFVKPGIYFDPSINLETISDFEISSNCDYMLQLKSCPNLVHIGHRKLSELHIIHCDSIKFTTGEFNILKIYIEKEIDFKSVSDGSVYTKYGFDTCLIKVNEVFNISANVGSDTDNNKIITTIQNGFISTVRRFCESGCRILVTIDGMSTIHVVS